MQGGPQCEPRSSTDTRTADPGTRLPGETASGASGQATWTATLLFLVVGQHRVELPPHRLQVMSKEFFPDAATSLPRLSVCRGNRSKPPHGLGSPRAPRSHELIVDRLYYELSKPVFILDRRVRLRNGVFAQSHQHGDHVTKL